jgi:methanogenic corrinoid protein MtbC1
MAALDEQGALDAVTARATSGEDPLAIIEECQLGKSFVAMMLRTYGFVVHDLEVDVPPADVARRAVELRPDIVGLSGLLTAAAEGMKETVAELRRAAPELDRPLPIIIGGGMVNEQIRDWTGADLWAKDAAIGSRLIREAIAAGQA